MKRALFSVLLLLTAAAGCGSGSEWSGPLPSPDGALFVSDVYPLLLRDCAFVSCHGGEQRFLQVLGPGRVRLDPTTKPDDLATLPEVTRSYERALSMLATDGNLQDSLLLSKPLEASAGGQGHKGLDELGRNVFPSVDHPGYLLLSRWARTTGAPPTAAQLMAANAAAAAEEPPP